MNTAPIDTVIFDLGGVLIDWNPRHLYRKLFEEEEKMEYFLEHICTGAWNEQQDAGYPLAQATEERVRAFPEHESAIRAFYGRWPEMLGGPISHAVELLEQIHQAQTHQLFALTNWSHETWHHAWGRYGFLRLFEGILVSGQEGLKKPDPKIYERLLSKYGIEPKRALFIDDSHRNAKAARALGIRSIHFTNPTALRVALQHYGIIS